MAATERFKVGDVEAALRATGGIFTHAAVWLSQRTNRPCSANTIKNYTKRHQSLARVLEEVVEQTVDMAEAELIKQLRDGNLTAIIFYLKTKGKHRGYNERAELTGKDGGPVKTEDVGPKLDLSKLSLDQLRQLRDIQAAASQP